MTIQALPLSLLARLPPRSRFKQIHLYIQDYVHFTDLSPDSPNISPLFHFISGCDPAARRGLAYFYEIKISIFRRGFHLFNNSMISSQFSNIHLSHPDPVLSFFMGQAKVFGRPFYSLYCHPPSLQVSGSSNCPTLPSSQ
jgi:hypothetical protein